MNECFGDDYLCSPTNNDLKKILARLAVPGFPGMLGSNRDACDCTIGCLIFAIEDATELTYVPTRCPAVGRCKARVAVACVHHILIFYF